MPASTPPPKWFIYFGAGPVQQSDGTWVRYSDYEKLEERAEIAYGAVMEKVEAEHAEELDEVAAQFGALRSAFTSLHPDQSKGGERQ